MCQIDHHSREKSGFGGAEKEPHGVELARSMDESHKDRDDSPRDHDAGDPPPGTPTLDDERSGNFEHHVTDEKHSRAQAKDPVAESQVMGHFQGRVGAVYPVEESNDVEQPKEGQQTKCDSAPRALLRSQRWGETHYGSATADISCATASPTSRVLARPPRSGVCMSGLSSTASKAFSTALAAFGSPRCSNIMAPDQIWAMGLAMPFPAMSGAEPCTGSNMEGNCRSGLRLAAGAKPIEPTTAAARSDKMSPNRFEATTTSNQSGLRTKWAARMSMWYWSVRTSGKFFATAEKRSSQKGML